ncbi:hypothetical protein H9651_10680 [Microbacterium sp. Sa4CUA7]|uniref:DUF2946 domain-containing protein n=1 Tax=Microbacterium pullorum TaxID=2762236 RepID=A0ABR8S3Q0_9MICO|nr:DUF6153 family protein [Microbacterium pullorum]MBD7958105.1 hypothetical protein [Microbacterium pullorum]
MASVVAAEVRRRRPAVFRVAAISALTAIAVIVGLLAMHTLNLNGGADAQPSSDMSMSMTGHHDVPLAAPAPVPHAAGCAECGPDGHVGMAMSCVIALLIVLFVIAPGLQGAGLRMPRRGTARGRPAARRLAASLSLHALCISRT